MNEKELANKYAELLAAKQRITLHPGKKGLEWKHNQLNTLYQDAVLKAKLPKEKLAEIEKQGEALHEQYEKEQGEESQNKETYKTNVLSNLEGTKAEKEYKKAYKQKEKKKGEERQKKKKNKTNVLIKLESTKEQKEYKKANKQKVLAFLDKKKDEKQEINADKDKREQEMAEFEAKYGYEKVYALK